MCRSSKYRGMFETNTSQPIETSLTSRLCLNSQSLISEVDIRILRGFLWLGAPRTRTLYHQHIQMTKFGSALLKFDLCVVSPGKVGALGSCACRDCGYAHCYICYDGFRILREGPQMVFHPSHAHHRRPK